MEPARHRAADPDLARRLKHSRHALWKNPEDLTDRQNAKLAWIAANDPRLHRAYLRDARLGTGGPAPPTGSNRCTSGLRRSAMYGPGAFCTAAASDDELGLAARGLCAARHARGTTSRDTAAPG